jgi:hypothetical protein
MAGMYKILPFYLEKIISHNGKALHIISVEFFSGFSLIKVGKAA